MSEANHLIPSFRGITMRRRLATNDPPAFSAPRDFFTAQWSGNARSIFVTPSDDDLTLFRMLRLPCTPAAGLEKLNGRQVRNLFAQPGAPGVDASERAQLPAVATGDYRLILIAWQVTELDGKLPDASAAVVTRLQHAGRAFRLDMSGRVGIWRPNPSDLDRIRSAVEFEDPPLLRTLLWQSARRSTCSVQEYLEKDSARNSMNYAVAHRELLLTIRRARQLGMHSPEIASRLKELHRSFDANVVEAIIHDAMTMPKGVDRSLMLAAAELMRHWHGSSALVRSTEDGIEEHFLPNEEELHPKDLTQRLRLVDGLVKIHRELTRGK